MWEELLCSEWVMSQSWSCRPIYQQSVMLSVCLCVSVSVCVGWQCWSTPVTQSDRQTGLCVGEWVYTRRVCLSVAMDILPSSRMSDSLSVDSLRRLLTQYYKCRHVCHSLSHWWLHSIFSHWLTILSLFSYLSVCLSVSLCVSLVLLLAVCVSVCLTASSMVIAIDDVDTVMEPLPKQLEAVKPATEFPAERHRWNTNEVRHITWHEPVCW